MSEETKTEPVSGTSAVSPSEGKETETTSGIEPESKQSTQEVVETKETDGSQKESPKKEIADQKKVVPEKYDLKLPAQAYLEAGDLAKIESYAKAQGFGNEQAQAILDFAEHQRAAQDQQVGAWMEACKSDKELGGENLQTSTANAKRCFDRFGNPELGKILYDSGYGNHPEVLRPMAKIGRAMAEDKFVSGNAPMPRRKSPEEILYGSNVQK